MVRAVAVAAIRPSGTGGVVMAHYEGETLKERWTPIFGQVVKVESRSDRRNLECHERDGATRLS